MLQNFINELFVNSLEANQFIWEIVANIHFGTFVFLAIITAVAVLVSLSLLFVSFCREFLPEDINIDDVISDKSDSSREGKYLICAPEKNKAQPGLICRRKQIEQPKFEIVTIEEMDEDDC